MLLLSASPSVQALSSPIIVAMHMQMLSHVLRQRLCQSIADTPPPALDFNGALFA